MQGGYQEPIQDDVKAAVLGEYMAGCSINAIATRRGLSWATVKKIVEANQEEIDALKTEKRKALVASSLEVAQSYLNHLGDPALVKVTKARDAAIVYGILVDKWQKETELAITFETMCDEAVDVILHLLADQLYVRRPALFQELSDVVHESETDLKDKARAALEEKFKDLKKKVAERQAMAYRPAAPEAYVELDGKKYTREEILRAVANASADMQIDIIELWNQAGQAEKGATA